MNSEPTVINFLINTKQQKQFWWKLAMVETSIFSNYYKYSWEFFTFHTPKNQLGKMFFLEQPSKWKIEECLLVLKPKDAPQTSTKKVLSIGNRFTVQNVSTFECTSELINHFSVCVKFEINDNYHCIPVWIRENNSDRKRSYQLTLINIFYDIFI